MSIKSYFCVKKYLPEKLIQAIKFKNKLRVGFVVQGFLEA